MGENNSDESNKGIITLEDVNTLVQNIKNNPEIKVVEYFVQDYSNKRVGFISAHKSLKIIVKVSNIFVYSIFL